jgi:hypothetical protein
MFGFPWGAEVQSERGIRSTSRSSHEYDFEDLDYDKDETYRVLDIGTGGAGYMEEIAEDLYDQGIEDFQLIGVDVNEEMLKRAEMADHQLMADGLKRTADKALEKAEEDDYLGAAYDAVRGFYNSVKTPVQREQDLPEEAELVAADAENLPFRDGSFDLVTSQFLVNYDEIVEPEQIRSEAERVAKSEGEVWFYGE